MEVQGQSLGWGPKAYAEFVIERGTLTTSMVTLPPNMLTTFFTVN